jgi:hypothetical protein
MSTTSKQVESTTKTLPRYISTAEALRAFSSYEDEAIRVNFTRADKSYANGIRYLSIEIHLPEYDDWIPLTIIHDFQCIATPVYERAKYPGARIPFIDAQFVELLQNIEKSINAQFANCTSKFISSKIRKDGVRMNFLQCTTKEDVMLADPVIRVNLPFQKIGDTIQPAAICKARLIEDRTSTTFTYEQCNSRFKAGSVIRSVTDLATIIICAHGAMLHCDCKMIMITGFNAPQAKKSDEPDEVDIEAMSEMNLS